ncbi:hypothetical protein MO867_09435 [Microbulbifer sp. OS29]|uniref:Uncharacterized protein n=1 Tax=Microbulbifer okhotskensis TaxID=2926617 RepID=A0A9X2J5M5_9GAMM|nr:hypothetical protein [Microbulbifer okhotskensis]MCO1334559.1 hypothetical protein [Microbulbifer okhotskensis]
MGVVLGISLFNEGVEFYREKAQLEGMPMAKVVHVEDLYPVLAQCIEENGLNYRLNRLASGALDIEEVVGESETFRVNFFRYHIRRNGNSIVIRSTYKDDALYFYLACRAASGHKVKIAFHGEHPFYNQDSIEEYQGGGNYHLVSIFDLQYLPAHIDEHCQRLSGYSEYWSYSFFIPHLGKVEVNNHTSDPKQPFYNLDFDQPERKLKIFQSATEKGGSYYFRDSLTTEKLVQLFEDMKAELQAEEATAILGCFEPIHQAYYDIESTIETEDNLASVVEDLTGYRQCIHGSPAHYEVSENADGSVAVQAYYFQAAVGYSCTISDKDSVDGHIYLDKLHDLDFYEQMCRAIAKHLCPTMPTVEDLDEVQIYYHKDSDRKLIASTFEETDITAVFIQVK